MKKTSKKMTDAKLGMNSPISRRDILHGLGALSAGALASGPLALFSGKVFSGNVFSGETPSGEAFAKSDSNSLTENTSSTKHVYPPSSTGMRGNHPGSFEVTHQLGREKKRNWGPILKPDSQLYDLVIVGAGISGLSAAHFYQKKHPDARILILDNHDDFGGHAKRNEFKVGDHTLIGHGGSQTLQEPSDYSTVVKELLDDIGVEVKKFDKAYDSTFYKRNKLGAGLHFNKEKWGVDRIVPINIGPFTGYLPMAPSALSIKEAVAEMPISDGAKVEFQRLLELKEDQISEIPVSDKKKYLKSITYKKFLSKHMNITEQHVFDVLQDVASDFGVGIDAVAAFQAMSYAGLPGGNACGLEDEEESEAYIHHFPDGNASIARLLVRKMIPDVADGNTMEDIVTAKFDYSALDPDNDQDNDQDNFQNKALVRLRLNSTVTSVQHQGEPNSAEKITVTYIKNGQAYQVQAKGCVLACNNPIIPYLCPEMPQAQREALDFGEKTPILYTSVALRNWQAWENMNIGAVISPGSYHINAMLDFPVSLGDYKYTQSSDKPVIVHMERFPHVNNKGKTPREQHRLGRHELITTSFETIERNVRNQLVSMLGESGFDPARDIVGITVNRWAHGYAYWYKSLFDTVYDDRDDARYPHMIARKPFGRITIANSDSGAKAMLESAVEQGHRAVNELKNL